MKNILVILVSVVSVAALGTTSASARTGGCWATVGLNSLPKGVHAGDAWVVDLTVRQHGRRLLQGAKPAVTIRSATGATTRFPARPTARTGVYRARVVFPAAGRWTYTVFDGFVPHCARTHTFAAVTALP